MNRTLQLMALLSLLYVLYSLELVHLRHQYDHLKLHMVEHHEQKLHYLLL